MSWDILPDFLQISQLCQYHYHKHWNERNGENIFHRNELKESEVIEQTEGLQVSIVIFYS